MTVFQVANTSQFDAAIRNAKAGDTIALAAGTYEKLTINSSRGAFDFAGKVTIAAADASRPPVINDITISGAGNIEFRGVKFDSIAAKSPNGPFYIQNSKKITLNDCHIEGHEVGGYGAGVGLRVRNCEDFTVMNSEIRGLKNGINLTNVTNARILDNDFRDISTDGMQVGGLVGATISGNDFRDFRSDPNLKHKDAIQMINGNDIPPSRNVLITGNTIVNPEQSHAIFMGNKLASNGDLGAYYRNIIVEKNYLHTAHKLGVTVEHGYGVKIRDNTIVQNFDIYRDGKMINIPLVNVSTSSMYVEITGNKVASVQPPANPTWIVSGNETGTRKILHWESPIRASYDSDAPPPADWEPVGPADPGPSDPAPSDPGPSDPGPSDPGPSEPSYGNGVAEEFRFAGRVLGTNDPKFELRGFSFAEGDTIVLKSFGSGAFSGKSGGNVLAVFDSGASVKLDSAVDVQELVAMSRSVSARTSGDTVTLRIETSAGSVELALPGFAEAFAAANQPDLF